MPTSLLEVVLDSNSPSPFANLKEDPSRNHCESVGRAKSFTEGVAMSSHDADENRQGGVGSTVAALHASFDAALLEAGKDTDSIFRIDKLANGVAQTSSWDGHEMNRSASGELSGRKHLRIPPREGVETCDAVAPGTVRKLQKTDSITPACETAKTPGRHLRPPGSAMRKSKTPTSAARKRRTPMRQRHSPRLQQRRANSGVPPTPLAGNVLDGFAIQSPVTPKAALFGKPPPSGTPTRTTPFFPQTMTKAARTRASLTGTTASVMSTSLDNSQKTATEDAASPTPFHFTSFPASLPRVNNRRGTDRDNDSPKRRRPPYSSRKGAPGTLDMEIDCGEADSNIKLSARPQHSMQNSSREDTHNSSLSSWSGDAGHLPPPEAPSFPPTVLEWKSPESDSGPPAKETDRRQDEQERPGGAFAQDNTLFAEDENEQYGPSDEELMNSPSESQVTRTRLNFNLVGKADRADEGGHRSDKAKADVSISVSTQTALFDASGCEDATAASSSSMTPNRHGTTSGPLFARGEIGLSPVSRHEEQFPFRMDAQCSPIPGIPDEEGGHPHVLRSRPSFPGSPGEMEIDSHSAKPLTRARKSRPPLIPSSSPRKRPQRESVGSATIERAENDESSRLSLSQESEESVFSTASSKMRRLRPMPDMSAFDAGSSLRSSSTVNTTGDESPGTSENRNPPASPKLVCPPTPMRTPAWAQSVHGSHAPLARSNSLIATKVLATCPIQVLDGHSSLESSLLDDDDDDPEPEGFAPRFPPVEEGMENLSDLQEMLTDDAPPRTKLTRHSSLPVADMPPPPPLVSRSSCSPRALSGLGGCTAATNMSPKTPGPLKTATRLSSGFGEVGSIVSFADNFENLGELGTGTFADVYKVRSRLDGQLYAVKRNRRQFRGKRDREMALAEVRTMQQLQSVCAHPSAGTTGGKANAKTVHSLFVLFFFQAWQEEGYFFCQTELCCRDTCRDLLQSLRGNWQSASKKYNSLRSLKSHGSATASTDMCNVGRLTPELTIWKICHDVAAGLSHVHAHRVVHYDIKLSNVFFIAHSRLGAMCKIGDFGMAGQIGSAEDGQEGDTMYMAPELLSSGVKHTSADIFSLGLSLYELASHVLWEMPSEGPRWLELRNGSHAPDLPTSRSKELSQLIQSMIHPVPEFRPTADDILNKVDNVKAVGTKCDPFLRDYIKDIEEFDRVEEQRLAMEQMEADERGQTPRNANTKRLFRFDTTELPPGMEAPAPPVLFSPQADPKK